MFDEALEELTRLATPLGLRVEPDEGSFALYRGDDHVGDVWYLEEFGMWTDIEPGSDSLESILSLYGPQKKTVRREEGYSVRFSYGRKRAPDQPPAGSLEKALDAAVTLAKSVAPKAVKVSVSSRAGTKSAKLS